MRFLSSLSPVLRNMRGHKPGFVRAQSLVSLSHYCSMFFGSLSLICHRGAECLEIDHGDHDQGQEPGAAHPDRVVQISAHEICIIKRIQAAARGLGGAGGKD